MKSKRLESFAGTVLIMVLTVMLVLIIMLMATLTVVSTASQRIYTKYEEQQAYYTARSALDVFVGKLLNDSQYGTWSGSTFETQGYLLQKQLYMIPVRDDPTNAAKNIEFTDSVSGEYYGPIGSDKFINYKVTLPDLSGGGLSTNGKFDDNTLNIRVEVLDRVYNCGSDGTPATGDRRKDSMKIKITANTTFDGVEGTAAVTLKTQSPPVSAATRAVTITGGGDLKVKNTTILGGLATESEVEMGNQGDYWGNIYLGGGVNVSGSGSRVVPSDDQWVYIKGSVDVQNNFLLESHLQPGSDASKRGNIVIGGDFGIGNNITVGGGGNDVKLVVLGDLIATQNNGHTHYGDLYIVGNVTSVPMKLEVHGNMYVDGNCDFSSAQNGVTIDGNLFVNGTYTDAYGYDGDGNPIRRNVSVNGGTYPVNGIPGGSSMPKVQTELKNVDGAQVRVPVTDDQGYMEINWPGVAAPAKVATFGAVFTQFYRYADPDKEDTITASEYAFLTQDELENLMKKAEDGGKAPDDEKRIHEYIAENGAVEVSIAHSDTIGSPGKYVVYPGHCGGGTLTIGGGGTVELYIMPGSYQNGGKVLVQSGTTLKAYGMPGTYSFDNFQFVTDEYDAGGQLYVGDFAPDGDTLMRMNINFYFEGECSINFNNSCIFVGHFYAPRSAISVNQGYSIGSRLIYNGVQYTPASGNPTFSFLGSLLCASYNPADSHGGIAFVQTTEEPPEGGLPCLTFDVAGYTRL